MKRDTHRRSLCTSQMLSMLAVMFAVRAARVGRRCMVVKRRGSEGDGVSDGFGVG